jgi:hypothetical protein
VFHLRVVKSELAENNVFLHIDGELTVPKCPSAVAESLLKVIDGLLPSKDHLIMVLSFEAENRNESETKRKLT